MTARRVQVRERRYGRELLVDGSFASCWVRADRPAPPEAGVWYAMVAPLASLTAARSLLVLGLGGGSCARLARWIHPAMRITGVEIDPEVVRAARRHFGLDELGVDVIEEDAREVLRRSRHRFDAVIEDVFCVTSGRLHKPSWLPRPGLAHARRLLRPGGLLISNTVGEYGPALRELRALFGHVVCIDVHGYQNRVLVAADRPLDGRVLRRAAAGVELLRPGLGTLRLRRLRPARVFASLAQAH